MRPSCLTWLFLLAPLRVMAMEAIADDSLAEATGQAGLTVTVSGTSLTASHVRYYDKDGFTGSTYTNGGSLDIANLSVNLPAMTTTLDVGSTGTGGAAITGLLLSTSALTGGTITTGAISTDAGNELVSSGTSDSFASVSLTNINLSRMVTVLTSGTTQSTSGITFTILKPVSMSATMAVEDLYTTGVFQGDFGVRNFNPGYVEVGVGNASQGLMIGYGATTIDSVYLANTQLGTTTSSGASFGSFYLSNVQMGASTLSITGH